MSDGGAIGVVVAHGAMAEGLVSATRKIAGGAADSLRALSNDGKSPSDLRVELDEIAGDDRVVVFVDIQTGSCGMAALSCCKDSVRRVVVCGVNLPMLVKLARVRADLDIKAAVKEAADAGRKYINVASEALGG